MITLKDFLQAVNYKITEGSDFGWQAYGSNAYCISSWNQDQNGYSAEIIFDTENQTTYEVSVCDYSNMRCYRYINPDFKEAILNEGKDRGVEYEVAWDGVKFIDLEVESDILEKINKIFRGEEYDTRVQIQLDFSDEELLKYMIMAHEKDITFNKLIELAIRSEIERVKNDTSR